MLSIGMNKKLKAGRIAAYNLPASKEVCGRDCPDCYAKKAQRIYKQVLPSRLRNLSSSMSPTFTKDMCDEINTKRKTFGAVRIHESGDFYSQKYIDDWTTIAGLFPDITFYAYTKREDNFNFRALKALKNFVLINSMKPGPINYGTSEKVEEWRRKGFFVCPSGKGNTTTCNSGCDYCLTKKAQETGVVFNKH